MAEESVKFSLEYNREVAANNDNSVVSLLKRVPVFSSLSDTELAFLSAHLVQRKFDAGELIFGEGESCAGLYVVKKGNVRIFKTSVGGREQVLAIDGPGSSIAELPVFDGGDYPASAQAITDCDLLFFSKQDFQNLLPATSSGRSQGPARGWRTAAPPGWDY